MHADVSVWSVNVAIFGQFEPLPLYNDFRSKALEFAREPKMKLPLHVLYLEDEVRDAELVQDTLMTHGITCEIRRVETETDFVAALDEGGFEVILANYTIAGIAGLSALNIAQQHSPDVPFIFVSETCAKMWLLKPSKAGRQTASQKVSYRGLYPHSSVRSGKLG
jgi:CheY-like chemotaxis protein